MKFEVKGKRLLATIGVLSLQAPFGALLGWQVGSGWADVFDWPVKAGGWIGAVAGALALPWLTYASARNPVAFPDIPPWLRRWHSHLRDPATGLFTWVVSFTGGITIWVLLDKWEIDVPLTFELWFPSLLVLLATLLLWVFGRRKAAIWCAGFGLVMWIWLLSV